jgi:hypothetical protein
MKWESSAWLVRFRYTLLTLPIIPAASSREMIVSPPGGGDHAAEPVELHQCFEHRV